MIRRWSIRSQLLALALVVLVPLLAVIAYAIHETAKLALERAHREVGRHAAAQSDALSVFFRDTDRTLAALARRPLIRELDPQHCDPALGELAVIFPELEFHRFNNLGIRDASGNSICALIPDRPDARVVRNSPAFQRAIRGNRFDVSDLLRSPVTRRWITIVSHPIRDDEGKAIGLIFLRVDLGELQKRLLGRDRVRPDAVVSVFDREAHYAMRNIDPDAWIGKSARNAEVVKRIGQGTVAEFHRLNSTDGIERIYAIEPVAGTGWVVGAGIPATAVYAPYYASLAWGIVGAVVALLFALLLATRVGRGIIGPVHALERAAHDVAGGERSARAPVTGAPEITTVATEFNRMLDAREHDEAEVREMQQRLSSILDSAMDAIVTTDASQNIVQFNVAAETMYGLTAAQAIGQPLDILLPEVHRSRHRGQVQAYGENGATSRRMGALKVLSAMRADGTEFPIEASISRVTVGGHKYFSVIHRDITARLEAEKLAARQADLYAALSQTNHAIVRMQDPEGLYAEICRICVEFGRAKIAYIGLIDNGQVKPVAWAGPAERFLEDINVPLDDPQMRGPVATALVEGRHCVDNDTLAGRITQPWRGRAAYLGTQATAAFPFKRGGRLAGALSLHVTEKDFFDARLIDLLDEMTADLSFGLDNYDRGIAQAESRRQEAAAYESFRKIFSSAPVAIAISAVSDGQIMDVNDAFASLFGYAREDLLTRSSLEIGMWANLVERDRFMTVLRTERRVRNFSAQLRTRSGELRDGVANAELIQFMGAPHTLIIVEDVTERLLTEKRIRRETDFYSAVSQTSMAIVHQREPQALFQEICRICVERGRVTIAFVGLIEGDRVVPLVWSGPARPYLDKIEIPLHDPEQSGPIANAIAEGRPYVCNDIFADPKTLPWRDAAAKIDTCATAAFPIRRGGRIAGVLSLHVTERDFFDARLIELLETMVADVAFGLDNFDRAIAQAEAQRAQQAALDTFSKVFRSAPMAMSISTVEEGLLEDVNQAYCDFFGYPMEDLLGHTSRELGLWAESAMREVFVESVRAHGRARDYEMQFRTRSGELRVGIINAELIELERKPRLLFILHDMTDRKRAEDMMRDMNTVLEKRVAERTCEIEAANLELESYGRTIAHDLRAPVRAIAGFTGALRTSLAGRGIDPTSENYLARVEKNAARMDTMVTDLLEFARSGRASLEKSTIEMNALVGSVIEELGAGLPKRPEFAIGDLPPTSGDPSLLRQVLVNLVSNAIKFSSKSEHPRVEINATREAGNVTYHVRDNGCGYDPEYSKKLFQPFERLHSQSEFEGNGVGLAIVQRIIARHGGTVSATSEPGKGAEFRFSLPV